MVLKLLLLFVSAVCCHELFEGDRCYNDDGAAGMCINLRSCKPALEELTRKRPKTCLYINKFPIVCCVEQEPATTRPASQAPVEDECEPLPEHISPKKIGKKAFDKCIDYQQKYVFPCEVGVALTGEVSRHTHCHHKTDQLILGGTDAEKYEFPHMVMLGFGELAVVLWKCGGAIISERFILTAGHCTWKENTKPVTHIVIGVLRRSDITDQSKIYKVKEIFAHPDYKSPSKYNDIALLETERVMELNQFTVPACLHTDVDDKKVIATGWGLTHAKAGTASDTLQKAVLSKVAPEECAARNGVYRHIKQGVNGSIQVCYADGDEPKLYQDRFESKDTCEGDSGGPIQIKDEKISCMYTIVGVTSFGKNCGNRDKPGVYTRVAYYLSWIEGIVWPN